MRYQDPIISDIFSEETKLLLWLKIELALVKVIAPAKVSSWFDSVVTEIKGGLNGFMKDVAAMERETNHDVGAFLRVLERILRNDEAASYLHRGFTSSDVVDTALHVQLLRAINRVNDLSLAFARSVDAVPDTTCVGYTHGMPAEEFNHQFRYQRAVQTLLPLNLPKPHLSGPLGDAKHLDLPTARRVLIHILENENGVDTNANGYRLHLPMMQCTHRSELARLASTLAINGSILEKLATDLRLLLFKGEVGQQQDVGSMGSSSMPHKVNPVDLEKVCGLARVLRGNAMVSLENINLWLERDISHSSTERLWIPESFNLYCHALSIMTRTLPKYSPTQTMSDEVAKHAIELETAATVIRLQESGIPRHKAWMSSKN